MSSLTFARNRAYLSVAFIFTASCASLLPMKTAQALEPGNYLCQVENAKGIALDGSVTALVNAPGEFEISAADTPVTPEELRSPTRALDYEPEPAQRVSAHIKERLFLFPMTGLRSTDGVIYTQKSNTITFGEQGAFLAYGLVRNKSFDGVAVYSGRCEKQ